VVPYYPISDDVLAEIVELKLAHIRARIAENHRALFAWDESLVDAVLARCTEVDSGARNVDHILNGTLLPELAQHVLGRIAQGERIERIAVRALETGAFEYKVD
jgi:type VI secretion system protein VasG